jgi:hypothetical protein
MVCTTCGHMLFRYGLRQLALGADPGAPTWLVHSHHPVLRGGAPLRELGPVPPLGGWPIEEQRRLVAVLQNANLQAIASRASFPDWLGYLGLALHYTEDAEVEDRELTRSWVPQLADLVLPESSAWRLLAEVVADEDRTLSWRHLEAVESNAAR